MSHGCHKPDVTSRDLQVQVVTATIQKIEKYQRVVILNDLH
jgi:hypothetical protein